MKILSITAQKPDSTGSGVYLTELVKAFAREGHEQAVVAGIYAEDETDFPEEIPFYPVYFLSERLPYPIVGMSDEMPYQSTRYRDMTEKMTEQFQTAFLEIIGQAVTEQKPDLILCHHLYLLTAIVREHFPGHRIYGFCHNTDLRQMQKTALRREYIIEQIRKLDAVFVPQEAQRQGVMEIFQMPCQKIHMAGMGYNQDIFRKQENQKKSDGIIRLIFAGKIAEKKGVMSLIRSLSYLPYEKDRLILKLAGGAGNEEEYNEIRSLAAAAPYPVEFLGKLPQEELAAVYNESDIFVLPSFFDGLPLTVVEAVACGDKVVMTDLPGMKDWIKEQAPKACVFFVPMPELKNTDEAVPESLPEFERKLAQRIWECAAMETTNGADITHLSWKNICKLILEMS